MKCSHQPTTLYHWSLVHTFTASLFFSLKILPLENYPVSKRARERTKRKFRLLTRSLSHPNVIPMSSCSRLAVLSLEPQCDVHFNIPNYYSTRLCHPNTINILWLFKQCEVYYRVPDNIKKTPETFGCNVLQGPCLKTTKCDQQCELIRRWNSFLHFMILHNTFIWPPSPGWPVHNESGDKCETNRLFVQIWRPDRSLWVKRLVLSSPKVRTNLTVD